MLDRDPIEIYTPRCVGHYPSIFTTEDEAPFIADYNQGMKRTHSSKSGIKGNQGKITPVNRAAILSPPPGFRLTNDPRRAWFCIKLPKPAHAVGIKGDPYLVEITGTNPPPPNTPNPNNWATAMRLIFDYDMNQPRFILTDGASWVFDTTLKDYSSLGAPTRFDITIRNAGPLLDPDHEDARACFEAGALLFQQKVKVANLVNYVDLDWEMDYSYAHAKSGAGQKKHRPKGNVPAVVPHATARPGTDCGNAIFASF